MPLAAGAGALSFLSPCVLPLVPPYLCYMAGVTTEDLRAGGVTRPAARGAARVLGSALVFVAGFSTVFVALGAGASTAWAAPAARTCNGSPSWPDFSSS